MSPVVGLPERLVFFDGSCGACNQFVQFLIARDREGRLSYAPLQGSTYRAAFGGAPDLTTIVVRDRGRNRFRSDAVLGLLAELGGAWRFVGLGLRLVPRPLRDLGYRIFARHRQRVPAGSCRLLTAEERKRFLP